MKAKINTYDPETGECSIHLGYKTFELEGINDVIRDYIAYKSRPLPSSGFDPWNQFRDLLVQDMVKSILAALVKHDITKDSEQFQKDIQEIYNAATIPIAFA